MHAGVLESEFCKPFSPRKTYLEYKQVETLSDKMESEKGPFSLLEIYFNLCFYTFMVPFKVKHIPDEGRYVLKVYKVQAVSFPMSVLKSLDLPNLTKVFESKLLNVLL